MAMRGMAFEAEGHESALISLESDTPSEGPWQLKVVCVDQTENKQIPPWLRNSRQVNCFWFTKDGARSVISLNLFFLVEPLMALTGMVMVLAVLRVF